MGQSTDAILCWGVQLAEDDEVPWAARAEELGGYNDPLEDEAIVYVLTGERLDGDSAAERLNELGIEVVHHGYHEDPMIIVAAYGTVTTAHRCSPQIVDVPNMEIQLGWIDKLNKAMPKLGIDHLETQWILCSWWSC